MIKYLHIDYLRTHPLNPNQPETHFLRLPHQLIFTLVLAGNFLAAVSFHTQAPFSLAEHSNARIALHPPSLPCARSGSNFPWGMLTQKIQSERRPFCTTCEEGQINGKSQEICTCFSRTSLCFYSHATPVCTGICGILLEKLHRFHPWPHTQARMTNILFPLFNSKS